MLEKGIAREPERKQITGVGRSAWWYLEKQGLAPRRVCLIGNRVGWRREELLAWVNSRPRAASPPEAA
jgi:prophage regulatory protein